MSDKVRLTAKFVFFALLLNSVSCQKLDITSYRSAKEKAEDKKTFTFDSKVSTDFNIGTDKVTITWSKPSNGDTQDKATYEYEIFRKIDNTFDNATEPFNDKDARLIKVTTENSFSDDDEFIDNSTYYYTVCVVDNENKRVCDGSVKTITIPKRYLSTVSSGGLHTCRIRKDNARIECWGNNDYGQLGTGDLEESFIPKYINSTAKYKKLSVGSLHTCALREDNEQLECWGNNGSGQLGDGTQTERTSPTIINPGVIYSQISAGGGHTCAIRKDDGTAQCWGQNGYGRLGDGTQTERTSPVTVNGGTSYSEIAAGDTHTCAIRKDDGTAQCWGFNFYGQLGDGTIIMKSSPTPVIGNTSYIQIAVGPYHTCAIREDNEQIECWGNNRVGALGNNTLGETTSPVLITSGKKYKQVTLNNDHSCAIRKDNNKIDCWGLNTNYQLANNNINIFSKIPSPISLEVQFKEVNTGFFHSCGILKDNEQIYCWGLGGFGQLGNEDMVHDYTPFPLNDNTNYLSLSIGQYQLCTLSNNSKVECYGLNADDIEKIENGIILGNTKPVIMNDEVKYKQITSSQEHTCAIRLDNDKAECWGSNKSGQLGDSTTQNRNIPVLVSGGVSYEQISAGGDHTCALRKDNGQAECWGGNSAGQLGNGTTNSSFTPLAVSGGTKYKQILAGERYTCAIRDDNGNAECWGVNQYGQLGDGSYTAQKTPVSVIGGSSYKQISTRKSHTCAIKEDTNQAECWGLNSDAQLGDGTKNTRLSPVLVNDGTLYKQISAGYDHTCAIREDNERVECWGGIEENSGGLGHSNKGSNLLINDTRKIKSITAGHMLTCGILKDNSQIICWGGLMSTQSLIDILRNATVKAKIISAEPIPVTNSAY